jgi:chemotaxis protein methyltransferase CheR
MQSLSYDAEILPNNYRILQQSVYFHVGIVLEDDKHYLFEGRLAPVVRELGLSSINELCGILQDGGNHEMNRMVAEAMTTNETYFFREPPHYDAIKNILLPQLREARGEIRKLRLWSAASSTGQEAYSLAMLLLEQGLQDWNIQILGTDFCSKVVERAKTGLYQQIEVNRGLPASLLIKYFHRAGLNWQIRDGWRTSERSICVTVCARSGRSIWCFAGT